MGIDDVMGTADWAMDQFRRELDEKTDIRTVDMINKPEVDAFLNKVREAGHSAKSIQGPPPRGLKYDNGDTVFRDVNIAWVDTTTGERCKVVYGEVI